EDRRRGDQHRAEIHAVEKEGDEAQSEDDDVQPSEPRPVEQLADIDALRRHPILPCRLGGLSLASGRMPRPRRMSIKMSVVIFLGSPGRSRARSHPLEQDGEIAAQGGDAVLDY